MYKNATSGKSGYVDEVYEQKFSDIVSSRYWITMQSK